ncbi:MAG: glycosyltransferase [Candidatus Marinimicrobia bacterium]|nr:glycosyltransferase [Candidatus Neomarinimicrobiota bacterium]|tara:strand:+ start:4901 stop:5848 length:948 start_codon:yes stop_codon:yes gene_type:complete
MKKIDLSIIIPIYNEEDSILPLYKQIIQSIDNKLVYEIIFINDGSTDQSLELINQLLLKDSNIKIINFISNKGKSEALNYGFKNCFGRIVITIDGDLQDDPNEFFSLIDKINSGSDMVTGWKKDRKDSISKKILSKIFNFVLRVLTGIKIHDFNCGLKAYKRSVVKSVNIYGGLHRFIPILANNKGFIVDEIIVNHREREFGTSKYGNSRIFHGFFDLITVLFLNKYFNRPLHLFGSLGFILLLAGFIINIDLTFKWFYYNQWITPFKNPIFFLGILLIVIGFQFFSTGLIGELIVYFNRQKQPDNDDVEFYNYD